jgi:ABC-type transport system involved in cytochrome c biogenesis ATPase subunit
MELGIIMLCEISQFHEHKDHMISLICGRCGIKQKLSIKEELLWIRRRRKKGNERISKRWAEVYYMHCMEVS